MCILDKITRTRRETSESSVWFRKEKNDIRLSQYRSMSCSVELIRETGNRKNKQHEKLFSADWTLIAHTIFISTFEGHMTIVYRFIIWDREKTFSDSSMRSASLQHANNLSTKCNTFDWMPDVWLLQSSVLEFDSDLHSCASLRFEERMCLQRYMSRGREVEAWRFSGMIHAYVTKCLTFMHTCYPPSLFPFVVPSVKSHRLSYQRHYFSSLCRVQKRITKRRQTCGYTLFSSFASRGGKFYFKPMRAHWRDKKERMMIVCLLVIT